MLWAMYECNMVGSGLFGRERMKKIEEHVFREKRTSMDWGQWGTLRDDYGPRFYIEITSDVSNNSIVNKSTHYTTRKKNTSRHFKKLLFPIGQ